MGTFDAGAAVSFGIQLPIQPRSTRFAEAWEAQAGVDELATITRVAQHSGFAYVAVCDHVAVPKQRAYAPGSVDAAAQIRLRPPSTATTWPVM